MVTDMEIPFYSYYPLPFSYFIETELLPCDNDFLIIVLLCKILFNFVILSPKLLIF